MVMSVIPVLCVTSVASLAEMPDAGIAQSKSVTCMCVISLSTAAASGTPDDEEAFYLRHGETRDSLKVRARVQRCSFAGFNTGHCLEQGQGWHLASSLL